MTTLGTILSASPVVAQWRLEDPNYVSLTGRGSLGEGYCSSNVTLDVNANVRLYPRSDAELIANSGYWTNYTAYPLAQYGDWYLISFEVGRSNYVGWTHRINIIGGPYQRCG